MATAMLSAPANYKMIPVETRLGEDTIGPGLVEDLQKYYDKTDNEHDRAKCLELLANIQTTNGTVHRGRPYSAFPSYGTGQDHSKNFLSPYQTSYNRDYPLKKPIDTTAIRPMTSHGFPPQTGSGAETHYTEEFRKKAIRPTSPLRPGTASGSRANKPHPPETFMVWKFSRGGAREQEGAGWSEQLTDEKINQVHKRMCQSTYQQDYLGLPQGFQIKSAYTLPPDWKENIPYTLDSVHRYCYQNPTNPLELQLPVTRYGSNTKKPIAATGTIPTASGRHMHIRNRTTYDKHFNDNGDAVKRQVRDLSHKLEADALRKYYEHAAGDDRNMARRLLENHIGRQVTPTPHQSPVQPMIPKPSSARPQARLSYRSATPASTPISTPYVPAIPPKDPGSRMSFGSYQVPQALEAPMV